MAAIAIEAPRVRAGGWRGEDLVRNRSWEFELDRAGIAELESALAAVRTAGLAIMTIDAAAFPLPGLSPMLQQIGAELRDGRGFALLHGFPVTDHALEEIEIMYWGLCAHLGTGLSQNSDGGLIHYVTEGPRRPNQGTRGVGFPRAAPLHIDLMDVVSLLCVRQAQDDPPSHVASSLAVYDALAAAHPEWLELAREGFAWDRMQEHGPEEAPASEYKVPVFSESGGQVSAQYNRNWIESAGERSGRAFTDEETALMDFIDETADAQRYEFSFGTGDIQFCNNYTVFHGRAAHVSEPEMERRRMLMRIWFDVSGFRQFSDEAIVRYGNGRHGQLGWTAAELRDGESRHPRRRRADGAVAAD